MQQPAEDDRIRPLEGCPPTQSPITRPDGRLPQGVSPMEIDGEARACIAEQTKDKAHAQEPAQEQQQQQVHGQEHAQEQQQQMRGQEQPLQVCVPQQQQQQQASQQQQVLIMGDFTFEVVERFQLCNNRLVLQRGTRQRQYPPNPYQPRQLPTSWIDCQWQGHPTITATVVDPRPRLLWQQPPQWQPGDPLPMVAILPHGSLDAEQVYWTPVVTVAEQKYNGLYVCCFCNACSPAYSQEQNIELLAPPLTFTKEEDYEIVRHAGDLCGITWVSVACARCHRRAFYRQHCLDHPTWWNVRYFHRSERFICLACLSA